MGTKHALNIWDTGKSAEESWPALGPGWIGQWTMWYKTFGIEPRDIYLCGPGKIHLTSIALFYLNLLVWPRNKIIFLLWPSVKSVKEIC